MDDRFSLDELDFLNDTDYKDTNGKQYSIDEIMSEVLGKKSEKEKGESQFVSIFEDIKNDEQRTVLKEEPRDEITKQFVNNKKEEPRGEINPSHTEPKQTEVILSPPVPAEEKEEKSQPPVSNSPERAVLSKDFDTSFFETIKSERHQRYNGDVPVVDLSKVISERRTTDVNDDASKTMEEALENSDYKLEENVKEGTAAIKRFMMGDDEEEDDEEAYDPIEHEISEIDDYTGEEDKEEVNRELFKYIAFSNLKIIACSIITVILAFLMLGGMFSSILPSFIRPSVKPVVYIVTTICLTLCAMIIANGSIISGIKNIFKGRCSDDGFVSVLLFFTLVYNIFMIINMTAFSRLGFVTFNFAAVTFLTVNLYGKRLILKNIRANFSMISDGKEKTVINMPTPEENSNNITVETGQGGDIMYVTKTGFVDRFIKSSFEDFYADFKSYKFNFILLIITIVLSIAFYIYKGSFSETLVFVQSLLCVVTPLFTIISYALPISKVSKKVRKEGGVICGSTAALDLNDSAVLVMKDEEIFADGDIKLHGIKVVGNGKIDDAIVNIAAAFNKVGGPLKGIFMKMLQNNESMLPRVDDVNTYENLGVSCIVKIKTLLIGNKEMMDSFGVNLGGENYELSLKNKDKHIMYVAFNYRLVALFVLSYDINAQSVSSFKKLEDEMVTVAVAAEDFNITQELLYDKLNINDKDMLKVLSYKTSKKCMQNFEKLDRAESLLASNTGLSGLAAALSGCSKLLFSMKTNRVIKRISSILGIVLISGLAFVSTFSGTTFLQILAYQALWSIPIALISSFNS